MKPENLTDEQFREARRQIVDELQAHARAFADQAAAAIHSDCRNYQNPPTGFHVGLMERARGYRMAADRIVGMEREGYDWSASADVLDGETP